jgi:glycosyltransferase 2 family protein
MSQEKKNRTKRLFLAIRLLVVAAGLLWAGHWLGQEGRFGKLVAVFRQIHPAIFIIALGGYVVGQLSVAIRWWILLRTQAIFIPLGAAARLHFLGLFYSNFMPSSVGGDLLRAWYVTKHTQKRFEAALSVVVDRIVGLLGSVVIAVVFYFLLPNAKDIELSMKGDSLGSISQYEIFFLWAALGIAAVFLLMLAVSRTRKILKKWWRAGCEQGRRLLKKLMQATILYCKSPVEVFVVLVLTIALQILTITGYWLVGRQIGVDVSLSYYYIFFTISWSIGMLPVSIGGAVLVEGSLAAMFVKFASVQAEAALALALCQRIIWMTASLPGGWIHLAGGHLPKDFTIDEDDKTDIVKPL